jgi:sulfoxide reductase catalytic subunit YedY
VEKRRKFLKFMVGSAMSMSILWNPVFCLVRSVYAKTRKIILPKGTDRETLKRKNPRSLDTTNLEITPLKEFDTMGPTDHTVDLKTWRLNVTGSIKDPLRLSYSEVVALPSIEKKVLLICPGFFANNGKWKGVSMKPLLEKVKIEKGATHVTFTGPKGGYEKVERFPIEDVLSDKVFLAYAVNGKALPQKHGFPLRIVAEGYYGDDWVKYVYQMKVEKR